MRDAVTVSIGPEASTGEITAEDPAAAPARGAEDVADPSGASQSEIQATI